MTQADNGSTSTLLSLNRVSKGYRMGTEQVSALRQITLTIAAGEFTTLVGPSGSGKSTMLNLCGLIDRPDSGSIALNGQEMAELDEQQLTLVRRRQIGFVFQGFNLVPVMSTFENVEYPLFLAGVPAAERRQPVLEMLDRVGLDGLERRRPDELSGGQRQRVAIARALVKRPLLVIADEPTANLDSATASQIVAVMHELGRSGGTTFLFATHDQRLSRLCDRVITMNDGVLL